MKKIMSVLLTLAMLVGLMPVMAVNAAWDGNSASSLTVQDGVYLISNAAELKKANELITANANGEAAASYKLTANIDFENGEWVPIACANSFYGTFDGDNHTVKNLKITNSNLANFGFFGTTEQNAVIQNLGIENININKYKYICSVCRGQ